MAERGCPKKRCPAAPVAQTHISSGSDELLHNIIVYFSSNPDQCRVAVSVLMVYLGAGSHEQLHNLPAALSGCKLQRSSVTPVPRPDIRAGCNKLPYNGF